MTKTLFSKFYIFVRITYTLPIFNTFNFRYVYLCALPYFILIFIQITYYIESYEIFFSKLNYMS